MKPAWRSYGKNFLWCYLQYQVHRMWFSVSSVTELSFQSLSLQPCQVVIMWCMYQCRLGRCIPFITTTYPSIAGGRENPCNKYYRINVDTVYLPNGRAQNDLVLLNSFLATFSFNLLRQECRLVIAVWYESLNTGSCMLSAGLDRVIQLPLLGHSTCR